MADGHCWHKVFRTSRLEVGEQEKCCYCGKTWSPELYDVPDGHGPHAPKTTPMTKPTGSCSGQWGRF